MPMKIWRTYVKNKIITITLKLYFFLHRLQLEEQLSNLCISQLFWDNLADGIFPRHKLQGVFTEVYEYMHIVLYITHRSAFFVPACVFLVRVGDKYVNHRPGGSYWVRLCPRFWVPVLKTKCTIFPTTDWPRFANEPFFFFFFLIKLDKMFTKEP